MLIMVKVKVILRLASNDFRMSFVQTTDPPTMCHLSINYLPINPPTSYFLKIFDYLKIIFSFWNFVFEEITKYIIEIYATKYFPDKCNEQIVLNNFKKELIYEIKQHLSTTESSKNSEKNEHITGLKDQIESLEGEII